MTEKQYETLVSEMADKNETAAHDGKVFPIRDGDRYSEIVSDEHTFITPHDPLSAKLLGAFLNKEEDKPYYWKGIIGDALEFQRTLCKIGSTIYNLATSSTIVSREIAMVNTSSLFSINGGYWYSLDKIGDGKMMQRNFFGDEISTLIYHLLVKDTMTQEMERNLKSLLLIIQILIDESSDGTNIGVMTEILFNLGYGIRACIHMYLAQLPKRRTLELSSIAKSLSQNDPVSLYNYLLINDDHRVHDYTFQMSRKYHCSETSIVLASIFNYDPIDNIFENLEEKIKWQQKDHR